MPDPSQRVALIPVAVVAVALIVLIVLVVLVGRDPVVEILEPRIASGGDEVVVVGRHFGSEIGDVVIAGQEVPNSNVVSWAAEEIRFVVPRASDSGLLYIVTDRGRSEGTLLQIRSLVPRTSFSGEGPGAPIVTDVDTTELQVGGLVRLTGTGFGAARRGSYVRFPIEGRVACAPCTAELSYAFWSDTEVIVRVPSGAVPGFLHVVTPWGTSNPIRVTVNRPAGTVVHDRAREIALRYGARVDEVLPATGAAAGGPGERDIVLRLPRVDQSPAQRSHRYLDDEPEMFRFERVGETFDREVIRTLLVDRYEVRSEIDPSRVTAAYEGSTDFFDYFTRAVPGIPVANDAVARLAAGLRTNRSSPYRIAEAAYAVTLDSLDYALGLEDRSVEAGLESGYGDDFTYAALFVSLLRAARVPARPVGGVLVTDDGFAYAHFWAEFFVTGIGWIPVDPALGDGAFPAGFDVPESPRAYYFGNLDNRRVAFVAGFDDGEPTFLDGVDVSPADPYTLQATYAEAGSQIDSFRLTWYRPRVIGQFISD